MKTAAPEPEKSCAPGVTRTPDPRIRNPLLYPAELRAHLLVKLEGRSMILSYFHGHILRSTLMKQQKQAKRGKERDAIRLGAIMPELSLAAKKFGNRLRHHITA